jgi:signal transduction histidine kinase
VRRIEPSPGVTAPPEPQAGPADTQHLRDAVAAVTARLEMPALLARVVAEAARLVDAGYGALGVVGPGGTMDHFVFTGVVDASGTAIGHPPAGLGALGQLHRENQPLLLHRIAGYPVAAGFPAGHPPMGPFLGVPLCNGAETVATLYLTEKRGGGDFTVADALVVETLAAAAGAAIGYARLREEGRRQHSRLEALNQIRAALLRGAAADEALALIAARIRELTSGDAVLLLLPDPTAPDEQLVVTVADGIDAVGLRGLRTPVDGSVAGQVYRTGEPTSVGDVAAEETFEPAFTEHPGYGPATFAPLGGPRETGVLVVAKLAGAAALSVDETEFVMISAGQAALALRTDEAQRAQQAAALLADRERIARDLHDQVIQRLFATGMGLESISRQVREPDLQTKLRDAVDELDRTVRDIRHTIFELQEPVVQRQTMRQQIGALLDVVTADSQLTLAVHVADSVDKLVPPDISAPALAVLGEAVTNVIRHARASSLWVSVTATDRLRIQVTDDGVGIRPDGRRSGLTTLADRARQLGGELTVGCSRAGGGSLTWDVPLRQDAPAARPEPARSVADG